MRRSTTGRTTISGSGTLVVSLDIATSSYGRTNVGATTFVADGTTASGAVLAEPSSIPRLGGTDHGVTGCGLREERSKTC